MTQKTLLALVRRLIADEQATGFTDGGNLEEPEGTQELLNYLDRAIDEYSKRQAANLDLRLVQQMRVKNGTSLPDDFLAFCGVVPFVIEGKVIQSYGNTANLPVRYFARLPYITKFDEDADLPYEHDQYMTIAALAAIYALNKHEFDVSQDLMLMGYGAVNNGTVEQ